MQSEWLQHGTWSFSDKVRRYAQWIRPQVGPMIGIFGSARDPEKAPNLHARYANRATEIGRLLGERGASLISGHCPGLPELTENGFKAARISDRKQPVIGVRIVITKDGVIFEETDRTKVDVYIECDDFGPRIEIMEALADGAIFCPGGIGTRLELQLFIQKQQLGSYLGRKIPLVLVGTSHWAKILDDFSAQQEDETIGSHEFWVTVTDHPEEAVELVLGENGNRDRAERILVETSGDLSI
ncbi:MAG: LOG family protein [Candidatus Kerfeldbacteria bacterium]